MTFDAAIAILLGRDDVKQDWIQGWKLITSLALEDRHPRALMLLGRATWAGWKPGMTGPDRQGGIDLMNQAADLGDAMALSWRKILTYLKDRLQQQAMGCEPDPELTALAQDATEWLMNEAVRGDPFAAYDLGVHVEEGHVALLKNVMALGKTLIYPKGSLLPTQREISVDPLDTDIPLRHSKQSTESKEDQAIRHRTAFQLFLMSAHAGHVSGMFNSAVTLVRGESGAVDHIGAREWLEKSAAQGEPDSQRMLARFLLDADEMGGDVDFERGMELLHASAEQSNAAALFVLGNAYRDGKVVEMDVERAQQCFEKSVLLGNELAMNNLAVSYYSGRGIERDVTRAYNLFFQAARLGNHVAAMNAAGCAMKGDGCEPDEALALNLYRQAAHEGKEKRAQRFIKDWLLREARFNKPLSLGVMCARRVAESGLQGWDSPDALPADSQRMIQEWLWKSSEDSDDGEDEEDFE